MKLLADENFPFPSIRLLRQAAYDIASISEDASGIEDVDVLARAVDEQRFILTFDRDYGELIYRLRLPAPIGVIYLRFRPHYPAEPAEILLNLFQTEEVEFESRFTILERDRLRQRPLP
jgi:predicted nuclease of predicted toxin-antitoxin system